MLFLPNYRAKYYDSIVKRCSSVAWKWCVSLDIAIRLALEVYDDGAYYNILELLEWMIEATYQHNTTTEKKT